MRKKIDTITVTKEIITYEALDGTIFDNEDECRKYEKTAQCAINGAFEQLPREDVDAEALNDTVGDFSDDDTLHSIYIEDANTLEVINRWLVHNGWGSSKLSAKDIGTILLYDTYDTDVWIIGTPEEYKKKFCDFIDNNLVKPLTEKVEARQDAKKEDK